MLFTPQPGNSGPADPDFWTATGCSTTARVEKVEEHSVDQSAGTVSWATIARFVPPPALCGFLLLLGVLFVGAHAAGAAVGPVSPGMHGPAITGDAPGGGGDGEMPMHHGGGHR